MIGTRLGSWIVEEEIGRGGMGTVYRARRAEGTNSSPEVAALKVLAAELAVEVGFQQRFQREINILQQLDHPVIVAFYESGSEDGRFWYAMEYIEGESFEQIRERGGKLPWPVVLDLAWQLAPALKHAHDRGVVHRDIKPSNLLKVTDKNDPESPGIIKLTDFGIASLFASPHLTVTGGVIGTPEYLSPEQAAGKAITKRSDLYSLGVVLYTLVVGTQPFVGEPIDLLHKHRYGQFDRPGRLVPGLHPDFEEVICNLLEKDPSARPADAGVLYRKLDSIRRKVIRQAMAGLESADAKATRSAGEIPGPATMVSQAVRAELEAQNRGGPIQRFFNHPLVIIVLFILCVGTIVWTLWPSPPETLFHKGAALMASADPEDWEKAWKNYFEPLQRRFPDHAYSEELEEYRQQLADSRAIVEARALARTRGRISEGQWFYESAIRQRLRGDEAGAKRTLGALIDAYSEVPAQRPWVELAEKELDRRPGLTDKPWKSIRDALDRAEKLLREGKPEEAATIRRGLRELYHADKAALEVIQRGKGE